MTFKSFYRLIFLFLSHFFFAPTFVINALKKVDPNSYSIQAKSTPLGSNTSLPTIKYFFLREIHLNLGLIRGFMLGMIFVTIVAFCLYLSTDEAWQFYALYVSLFLFLLSLRLFTNYYNLLILEQKINNLTNVSFNKTQTKPKPEKNDEL